MLEEFSFKLKKKIGFQVEFGLFELCTKEDNDPVTALESLNNV